MISWFLFLIKKMISWFYSCTNDILYPNDRFGHLACFTSDVEMFLEVLTPDKKIELLEKLKETTAPAPIITTKALGQSTTLLKLQVLSGNMLHLPVSGASLDFISLILVISVWFFCMTRPTSYVLGAINMSIFEIDFEMAKIIFVMFKLTSKPTFNH